MSPMADMLASFPTDFRALVFGARGGLGAAFVAALQSRCQVTALTRADIDICDEAALAVLAEQEKARGPLHLIINATGLLHDAAAGIQPEKALKQINAEAMAQVLAVNAVGPALIAKYFLPLLAREEKAVMAHLSARVGSISDNRMGGWVSYRAAKAAVNQIVHTAAIEIARSHKQAVCVALHPGTVATEFTANYPAHHKVTADVAAQNLLQVVEALTPSQTGGFFDYAGQDVVW